MVLKARRKRGRVGRALGNPRRQIYVWEDTVGLFLSERRQKKLCLFESFLDSLPFCPISSFAMFNKKPNHFPQSCWFDLSISFWRCCESTSHSCRDTGSSLRKVLPNSYCYNAIAACFKKYFKETDLSVTRWLFKSEIWKIMIANSDWCYCMWLYICCSFLCCHVFIFSVFFPRDTGQLASPHVVWDL